MKTRNIIAILAALPIMAGFTGCKSDDELSAVASKDMLIVEGGNIELRSGDELKNVTITANCGWQLNVIQDTNNPWNTLSVQPQRGSDVVVGMSKFRLFSLVRDPDGRVARLSLLCC